MSRCVTLSLSFLGFAIFALLSAGCSPESTTAETNTAATASAGKQLMVVCTTGHVSDMLLNVGGPHVRVEALMGPGIDPHLYRATLKDIERLNHADVVFYSGLHLEGRLAEMLENFAERKPVFAVTETVLRDSPDRLRKSADFAGHYDPHVWFDVDLWAQGTNGVADHLSKLDPAHAAEFRANAAAYVARLEKLHVWCHEQLTQIPPSRRVLVTAHDAFGYFGKAYDVEVHGLQGISTVDEADVASIGTLVQLLVDRGIKAVFVESSVPPKNIESLIEGCASRGHKVVEGGELFSDALGPAGTPSATYVGTIEHNVNTIVNALK